MPSVVVKDISMTFERMGAVDALTNVSFRVDEGQFVSVVGPSGCGKTTLLRVLAGVQSPTSGTFQLESSDGGRPGVVFQESSLLPWRTVVDNICYGLWVRGMGKAERARCAERYLELVGLTGFGSRYPYELSGGMKQRVNLARALAIDPQVLLMDEPFASLDSQTREAMQEELLRIWGQTGKTVIFITHQVDEAIYLSDRVLVLSARPGRLRADVQIELPRPRKLAIKRRPEFISYLDLIWGHLESNVPAAGSAGEGSRAAGPEPE